MRKIFLVVAAAGLISLGIPATAKAASQIKIISGTITKITGNQLGFKTSSAASYSADTGSASLVRKNGAAMNFGDFLVGDKVQVKGTVWSDNSISAIYIRDMSLYAHSGSFSGKVISLDPAGSSITIQSGKDTHILRSDNFTSFKKNGVSATFNDITLGMTAKVKGTWDRTNSIILAKSIEGTLRLISITFTGQLMMKSDTALTILSSGVLYGVDITKAKLTDKKGKQALVGELGMTDTIKVTGKHASESVQVIASEVKDTSL